MNIESQNFFLSNFVELFEETEVASIRFNTEFKNIDEWDSFIALSVIAMIDEQYNVKLTGDDIQSVKTVEDLYNKMLSLSK